MPSKSSTAPPAAADADGRGSRRVLKKYPNRRLYDTQGSSYITLADVKQMVMAGEDFEVRDAKTSEDLTRSILLQIILEEEAGGVPMFSTAMLAQLIRFYGHAMQGVMGSFLEQNLRAFMEMQSGIVGSGKNPFDPAAFSPEAWARMFQAPAQGTTDLVNAYVEQGKAAFEQWQEQLRQASQGMFPAFPPPKPPR
jgi:polyhydroxyalkanoate synthesis repressor PhaR